jgi:hypothetical protein
MKTGPAGKVDEVSQKGNVQNLPASLMQNAIANRDALDQYEQPVVFATFGDDFPIAPDVSASQTGPPPPPARLQFTEIRGRRFAVFSPSQNSLLLDCSRGFASLSGGRNSLFDERRL